MKYRNAEAAFVSKLRELRSAGHEVTVRGSLTKELSHQTVLLASPLERCIVVPHRRNNIFATIAETIWVIAGRNDVQFLTGYLPRAIDFSDDGTTWRAGYGPRLRDWEGVDQLAAVRQVLLSSSESRRAVMSIFDPARDFEASKDIPCTNWLHFTVRNGALDLNVAVRSNDLIWGFSGINTFEWSVLQEMMAFWLGTSVGQAGYFISSLHLYERHFPRADRMLAADPLPLPYAQAPALIRFGTPFADLDAVLEKWFLLESRIRTGTCPSGDIESFPDPLLRDFLWMLRAYWAAQLHSEPDADQFLARVEDRVLAFAGAQHFRGDPPPTVPVGTGPLDGYVTEDLIRYLSELHKTKDAMYGASWKRRGEQISIMANIARKIDRLVMFEGGAASAHESAFDTAADLLIYTLKYETYLNDAASLPTPENQCSWSDGVDGFDHLVVRLPRPVAVVAGGSIAAAVEAFETVEHSLESGETVEERLVKVRQLALMGWALLTQMAGDDLGSTWEILAPGRDVSPAAGGRAHLEADKLESTND